MLRDTCYPGWVAQVDGQPAAIDCVDTLFRAVHVPAGEHTIVFSYAPQSVNVGAMVSVAGGVLFMAVLALALRRRK